MTAHIAHFREHVEEKGVGIVVQSLMVKEQLSDVAQVLYR